MDIELKEFENKINSITEQFMSLLDANDIIDSSNTNKFENSPVFKLGTEDIKVGGIPYPKHAVKFDTAEQLDLNKKLEGLYEDKRNTAEVFNQNPSIAFSDSNIGKVNSFSLNGDYASYNSIQAGSTLNDKEVYEMANNSENTFYSFATIPADKALVEKRDWKDVLFMDIPWDTKIDIWGQFKKLITTDVKFTF